MVLILLPSNYLFAQGINNNWITGYSSLFGGSFGVSIIDFYTGSATVNLSPMEMEFRQTHANISDKNGNLLFYTNGYYIADATGDTMMNGGGINPSVFTAMFPDGLTLVQSHLFVPMPGDSTKYYLIHTTRDDLVNSVSKFLYYSIIDMSLNGGLGAVTTKNQILISDDLTKAKLAAVKHGNGRDWWIITHELSTNNFYKFLVTPSGISSPISQNIGIMNHTVNGQVYFSTQGDKYINGWRNNGFELYDFDRCTGIFSNDRYVSNPNSTGIGACFSNDGKLVYISAGDSLHQYDITSTNILATKTTVAVWDSFYSGVFGGFPTWFQLMALAPDGKIYITTGNSTFHYHIIDQPDSLGTACNVIQHGLDINHYYFNTLPNHPNYHLGPLVGSICDTVYTGIPPPEERLTLKLYPNPNIGSFQITYTPLPENLTLQVFNILGEEVHAQQLPQWSQLQNISVPNLSAGVYMATITSSASSKSIKFLVE